jgi:excisionase family DNA binding protein
LPSDEWLTVSEAASVTGLSEWKVRQLADNGTLASSLLPGSKHRRILATSAQQLRDQRRRDASGQHSAE